jgi:hypothetical protein
MQKSITFLERYAGSVLRYGLSAVILWFSLQQFLHTMLWTAYVPDYIVAMTHLSAAIIVIGNAIFELIFGILLAFGWQTRIVALLLAFHLFDIMWTVGYGEIGVRDFGLAVATFVIFMNGSDLLAVQQKRKPAQIPAETRDMSTNDRIVNDRIPPPRRFV